MSALSFIRLIVFPFGPGNVSDVPDLAFLILGGSDDLRSRPRLLSFRLGQPWVSLFAFRQPRPGTI